MLQHDSIWEALSNGLLLSGMVVGTWEFGEFLSLWWRRFGPALTALLVPWGLFFATFSHIPIPLALYVIIVGAVWLWEPRSIAAWATVSFMLAWEVERSVWALKVPPFWGAVVLLIYGVGGYVYRTRFQRHPIRFLILFDASIAFLVWWFYVRFSGLALVSEVLRLVTLSVFIGIYSVFRNHRARVQETMRIQATRDPLTGALTRNGLQKWLRETTTATGAVFMIDLDDFKPFNDLWGHRVGDEVLKTVCDRIRSICRPQDAVVRPGGDEFSIWIPGVGESEASELAKRLHAHISREKIQLNNCSCSVSASVGWAVGPLNEETNEAADQALLRSKHLGKNQVVGADEEIYDGSERLGFNWWEVESMRRLWQFSASAVALTDLEGNILAANSAYLEMGRRFELPQVSQLQGAGKEQPAARYSLVHQRQQNESLAWALQYAEPILGDHREVHGYFTNVRSLGATEPIAETYHEWEDITIEPVFQPIIELKTGRVLGYEALSRPTVDGLLVPPMDLFTLATELHQVAELDQRCLDALVSQLQQETIWQHGQKLFVNIRPDTLINSLQWRNWLNALTEIVGVDNLILELSEEGILPAKTAAVNVLLRHFPDAIWAIDDWGSGNNFVPTSKETVPTWIKLDRNLVKSAFQDSGIRELLLMFVQWAHKQGIQTVAEGVETEQEARQVAEWGVSAGQGFYWGHPLSLRDHATVVTER